jgi:hypothetical protein
MQTCVSHPREIIDRVGKFNDRMMEVAGTQHFVLSRAQALDLGTRHQVDNRVRRGGLDRVFDSVYRIPGSPQTYRQRLMAATFAGGKFNVGSLRAAAALDYLPGGEELVEVTSLRHHRARHEGVIVHESRFLQQRDIKYVDNIPITRTARTLNDFGFLVETGQMEMATLDHAMHDAVRRALVEVDSVWREWDRLGRTIRPGGRAMEAMLKRFVPPRRSADTSPELRLLQIIRHAKLPEPTPQYRVWLSPTRWVDLDFAFVPQKGYAEFDSYKYHGNRDKFMKDASRRLALEELGWRGVHVTDDELDSGAAMAMRVLRAILTERR